MSIDHHLFSLSLRISIDKYKTKVSVKSKPLPMKPDIFCQSCKTFRKVDLNHETEQYATSRANHHKDHVLTTENIRKYDAQKTITTYISQY